MVSEWYLNGVCEWYPYGIFSGTSEWYLNGVCEWYLYGIISGTSEWYTIGIWNKKSCKGSFINNC